MHAMPLSSQQPGAVRVCGHAGGGSEGPDRARGRAAGPVHPHTAGIEVLLVSRRADVARDAEEIAWARAAVAELGAFAI